MYFCKENLLSNPFLCRELNTALDHDLFLLALDSVWFADADVEVIGTANVHYTVGSSSVQWEIRSLRERMFSGSEMKRVNTQYGPLKTEARGIREGVCSSDHKLGDVTRCKR